MKQKVLFKTVDRPTKDQAGRIVVHNVRYGAGPDGSDVTDFLGNVFKDFGPNGLYMAFRPSTDENFTTPNLFVGSFETRSKAGHALQRVFFSNQPKHTVQVTVPTQNADEQEPATERLVTRDEAMSFFGCSKDALRKRIKRGTVQVRDGMVVLPV